MVNNVCCGCLVIVASVCWFLVWLLLLLWVCWVFAICFVVYFMVSKYVIFCGLFFYIILVCVYWVFKFNFLCGIAVFAKRFYC